MAKANADAIRRLREDKGWSQAKLAHKAGIDPKTLSSVLNGNPFREDTISRIADALAVTPADILERRDAPVANLAMAPASGEKRYAVLLALAIPFDGLERPEGLARLVAQIGTQINAQHGIEVLDLRAGSVLITLELTAEDLTALIRAAMELNLDEIGFRSLHVLDEDFEMPDNLPPILGLDEILRLRKQQRRSSRKKPGSKDNRRKKPNDA